jgi:hypothetical protein
MNNIQIIQIIQIIQNDFINMQTRKTQHFGLKLV